MGRNDCETPSHHQHERVSHHCHSHNDESHVKTPPLSPKERLILRLEHYMRHNSDHADSYGQLADAAAEAGGEQAAQQIRWALACITQQNDHLEKALTLLKSASS